MGTVISPISCQNPIYRIILKMVRLRGLEPLTYRSGICRSIQLSYRRILRS